MNSLPALLRFHSASGTRLAVRASVPIVGAFVVAVGLSQYPGATMAAAAALAASGRPDARAVLATTALAIGVAAWAVPRVTAGAAGWLRSLPAGHVAHRRAQALGIAAALAPVLLLLAAALLGAGALMNIWNPARIAALVPFAIGCAFAVAPVRRGAVAAPLATIGAAISIAGGWAFVAGGAALVALADLVAGAPASPRRAFHGGLTVRLPLTWRIPFRAIGGSIVGAWIAGGVPLIAGALFMSNNELPDVLAGRAARLAIGLAIAVTLAGLADRLALHRPPWPWARSLPWSSRRRAGDDAIVLSLWSAPVLLAGLALDPAATLLTSLVLPLAALRAAAAMRRAGTERTAASGAVLVEQGLGSLAFALIPWLALIAVAAIPWALRETARRESHLKVSRFAALHHLAAGDPSSWTGR